MQVSTTRLTHLLLVCLAASRAFPDGVESIPVPSEPLRPDPQQRLVEVPVDANWQDVVSITFEVRRTDPSPVPVWAFCHFTNDRGWLYQSVPVQVPKDGTWTKGEYSFGPRARHWFPSGHLRDLDDFALSRVTRFGFKCSSLQVFPGSLRIRALALQRREVPGRSIGIFDLVGPEPGVSCGGIAEIRFRVDRPIRNPFDAEEADIRARFTGPGGMTFDVLAFYAQEFVPGESPAAPPAPVGAGEWRVRFRPPVEGAYRYRILIHGRYETETEELPLSVGPRESSTARGKEGAPPEAFLLRTLDRFGASAFVMDENRWTPAAAAPFTGQFPFWSACLEWTPPRPGYGGLGQFNQERAWQLDRVLAIAADQNIRYPLRILGNEEFHDVSTHVDYPFRWSENPYRQGLGGPVPRPSAFFASADARQRFSHLLRYTYARFSAFASVSHFLLAMDYLAPKGVPEWHQDLATFWGSLPGIPGTPRPSLLSLHPHAAGAPESIPGPAFVPANLIHGEIRRYVAAESADWLDSDALTFDVELPADAPGGMRCVVAVQDDEGWWYQATPTGFLRPDDVTRVQVRMGSDMDFQPAGHGRPWSASVRPHLRSPEVRIYSPHPCQGTITLTGARLVPSRPDSPQRQPVQLANLRMLPPRASSGGCHEVAFQLSKAYRNPFDPQAVAIEVEVTDPEGRSVQRPAFLYQGYALRKVGDKEVEAPEGPTEWHARLVPQTLGLHSVRVLLREQGTAPRELAKGSFDVQERFASQPAAGDIPPAVKSLLVSQPDRSSRTVSAWKGGAWAARQPMIDPARIFSAGSAPEAPAAPQPLWLANLAWHEKWGQGYHGLSRLNLLFAHRLDGALGEAAARGLAFPIRINGNEEFHVASANVPFPYRWPENPLSVAAGGPLAKPSAYFENPEARRHVAATLRYLVARFAPSSAVSGVVFANDMMAPGAEPWHQEMARQAAESSLPASKDMLSYHPMASPSPYRAHPLTLAFQERPFYRDPPPANTPGREIRSFIVSAPGDWSRGHLLEVRFDLPPEAPPDARVLLGIKDDDEWWYQAIHPAFLRAGDTTTLLFSLVPGGDLVPVGHSRPWSNYARLRVAEASLRLFASAPYDGPIRIPSCQFLELPVPEPPLEVVSLTATRKEVPVSGVFECALVMNRPFENPFDPRQVEISATFRSPSGRERRVAGFFAQNYLRVNGKLVADGPEHWKIRFRPAEPGPHTFAVAAALGGRAVAIPKGGDFVAVPGGPPPRQGFESPFLLGVHDLSYPTVATYADGRWQKQASPRGPDAPLWHVVLEWTRRWGKYRDIGRYNLETAWELDQELDRAAAAGQSYPIRLNGNMEFHNRRVHRWPDNPLNAANGGPLATPSQYFSQPAVIESQKTLWRYLVARFGEMPAVSDLVLANDMPEAGAEEWHRAAGAALQAILSGRPGTLLSYHPLAEPAHVQVHRPTVAFQPRPFYKDPPPEGAKGREVQALANGPAGDWSRYSVLKTGFRLPPDAPPDVRVLLSLKDEDGWWYQTIHPSMLRPGDITSLLFYVAPGGDLAPVGHGRPWSDYTRFRAQDVTFRFFSSQATTVSVQAEALEFWESPATPAPLQVVRFEPKSPTVPLGDAFDSRFSLSRAFPNPCDPSQVDVRATFRAPSGRTRLVHAFFTQDYQRQGNAPVPSGPEYWGLRFRPTEEGKHTFAFDALVDGKPVPLSQTGEFTASPPARRPAPAFQSPAILTVHDFSYRTLAEYTQDTWRVLDKPLADQSPLWHPVLQWTERWGKYRNLERPNLEAAWEFEQQLIQAQAAGAAFPLRLNGNMEFFNRRTYRWPDNPLNMANGGPLPAPSHYYHTPKATEIQKKSWAYTLSRFGELPAVTDFVLAADMPAEGAEAWHAEIGRALRDSLPPGTRLLSCHPQVSPHQKVTIVADFERSTNEFKPESLIDGGAQTQLAVSSEWASHGATSLAIRRNFTGTGEAPLVADIDQDWYDYDTLVLDAKLPDGAPHDMRLMVFVKDRDHWYYQNLLEPFLIPGDVTRLIVDLTGANASWSPPPQAGQGPSPWRHSRPWSDHARSRVRQIGFRIFSHKPYDGAILVDNLQLWQIGRNGAQGHPRIVEIQPSAPTVAVYDRFELTFRVDREFRNPFDPDEVNITARFVTPKNETRSIPAIYYQDYDRSEQVQDCLFHKKKEPFEFLTPKGPPVWKIRFTPTEPGAHPYSILINGRLAWPAAGTATFQAAPAELPGFIRLAADKRHFEHANGTFFYPIGHNLRSPTDSRNMQYYAPHFEQEWHRGIGLYDAYFQKMKENGLNWARVWQCSWWLGLEWTRDWPGYHGLGYYNLENAWRLDYLLNKARECGVYLQIDTTNHGQFSLQIDSEWANNPYNQGNPIDRGPLSLPRLFFTEDAARAQFAKRVRYTAGRWGYSPQVFSWILMTECEFTDDYWSVAAPMEENGRHPRLVQWHEYAAGLMKSWDPNHVVATHFSHPFRGYDIFASPAVEYVESNAYWQDWKYEKLGGPVQNTIWINRYAHSNLLGGHKKPVLIGEYGGNVYHNAPDRLDIELHIGTWSQMMVPYAGSTGYWWWPWLHYKDRYGHLRAAANFMKGEDRRGKDLVQVEPSVTQGLLALGLQNQEIADLWIYHPGVLVKVRTALPDVPDAAVTLTKLQAGAYQVEFWDTYEGKVLEQKTIETPDGTLPIPLQVVKGDVALKVRRVKP